MPRTRKDEAPILVDSPLIQGRYAETMAVVGANMATLDGAR
jgi:hypothetical protein